MWGFRFSGMWLRVTSWSLRMKALHSFGTSGNTHPSGATYPRMPGLSETTLWKFQISQDRSWMHCFKNCVALACFCMLSAPRIKVQHSFSFMLVQWNYYKIYYWFLFLHRAFWVVHSPTNALFINLIKSFKLRLKYTIISLLHVSVFNDHHRGALSVPN